MGDNHKALWHIAARHLERTIKMIEAVSFPGL
jgi:hypothetical protein